MPLSLQRYNEGDACDITGEPRQTEVRYVCAEDGKESLASVKEASTCQYLVVVSTPLLCEHAAFKVKQVLLHTTQALHNQNGCLMEGQQHQDRLCSLPQHKCPTAMIADV